MRENKVSIILPVYNVEKYLAACLDSVLAQTHKNLEIILVNDGSLDSSLDIANTYAKKDNRIKVIHKDNEGVSVARNVGIDNATGEYVCFCDSDDLLMPDYVEYLLNMARETNADISVSNRFHYNYFSNSFVSDPTDSPYVMSGKAAALKMLYYHFAIGCYNKLFRREFLGSDIRFIPGVFVGEGFNFNVYAMCKAAKVAVGNRRVYIYRRTDNDASCMILFRKEKCDMAIKAIDIIRERLPIKDGDMFAACDYAKWHTTADMFNWLVQSGSQKEYPELYSEYRTFVRNGALKAIKAPVKPIEKLKASVEWLSPDLWVLALKLRQRYSSLRRNS